MNIALKKTKEITRLIRDRWDQKDTSFGLLEFQSKKSIKSDQDRASKQKQFIQKLNEELEENRISNPSKEDDEEMNKEQQEEVKEQ